MKGTIHRRVSLIFFFSSRRRHTRLTCDWSSDCALPISAVSGGPTVVKFLPLLSVPVTVVFEPFEPLPKSTVLTLLARTSVRNCEYVRETVLIELIGRKKYSASIAT